VLTFSSCNTGTVYGGIKGPHTFQLEVLARHGLLATKGETDVNILWQAEQLPDLCSEVCQAIRALLHWNTMDLALKVDYHNGLDLGDLRLEFFWGEVLLPVSKSCVAETARQGDESNVSTMSEQKQDTKKSV
jgi:hypothetical protein